LERLQLILDRLGQDLGRPLLHVLHAPGDGDTHVAPDCGALHGSLLICGRQSRAQCPYKLFPFSITDIFRIFGPESVVCRCP
jgi:hypothetical protein